MSKTVNGAYRDHDQAKNTWDDLIATGIPRDNIYIDEDAKLVKVIVPAETEREVREILTVTGCNERPDSVIRERSEGMSGKDSVAAGHGRDDRLLKEEIHDPYVARSKPKEPAICSGVRCSFP